MAFGIFGKLFSPKQNVLKVPSVLIKVDTLKGEIDLDLLRTRINRAITEKENDFVVLTGRDIVSIQLSEMKFEAKVWPDDVLGDKPSNYVIFISVSYKVEYQYSENTGRMVDIKGVEYKSAFSMYTVIPSPPLHIKKKFVKFNIE